MDEISRMFLPDNYDYGSPLTCKSCEYTEFNGTTGNDSNCRDDPDQVPSLTCPMFASVSCHKSYSKYMHEENGDFFDTYARSCSPFETVSGGDSEKDNRSCVHEEISDFSWNSCKENCFENDCNSGRPPSPRSACIKCGATKIT